MKNILLYALDELNEEHLIKEVSILKDTSLSREEKSDYARYIIAKEKESFPELHNFHYEVEGLAPFDYDNAFDYFVDIFDDYGYEEGMKRAVAEADKAEAEYYDLGFDY